MVQAEGVTVQNYCWGEFNFSGRNIKLLDTSLRDGCQSGVIRLPSLEEEIEFTRRLIEIGVDKIDISLPNGRGPRLKNAIALARTIPTSIDVVCLARTQERDIHAANELLQGSGRPIEGIIFVGSSARRRNNERWVVDEMTRWMAKSVAEASREGITPTVATEHTTETEPSVVERIFRAGLENGGRNVCIADTTGIATYHAVRQIIRFFQKKVLPGFGNIEVQWHGHNDFDLSVNNSFVALEEGADCVHGSTLGIGERSGNAKLEPIMMNLKRFGDPKRQDLTRLLDFIEFSSRIFNSPIPTNYPGLGVNNRLVASGIHAAEARKARLSKRPSAYEGVPQSWFGLEAEAVIGPVSGEANVLEVLDRMQTPATSQLVEYLLSAAAHANKILPMEEVENIVRNITTANGKNHGNGV